MEKSVNNLIPEDFRANPIWRPVDDFEDEEMAVVPYQGEVIDWEEIYLIAVIFKLADGSEWEGYVRFSWGSPMEMAIAINEKEFLLFMTVRRVETEKQHLEFASKLNKSFDEVFPIEYQSRMKLIVQSTVY